MDTSLEKLKQQVYEMSVNNSQEALKSLYLAYYSKLFKLAVYYVKSESLAEEIVSDTFMSVWEQRSQLLEVHNFSGYIYQIVRNISINYLRKEAKLPEYLEAINTFPHFSTEENPESKLISSELMSKLNEAIENLPDRCKLVFKLIREENLKYKEVAVLLNISVKTAEAHMALAIKRLRDVLRK